MSTVYFVNISMHPYPALQANGFSVPHAYRLCM